MRSIRLQISEHALGYAWTLIIPMLYAFCYIFIKKELVGGAVTEATGLDAMRAFMGILLFQCWMQVVQDMSEMIRRQRGMLRGLDIGPAPFVLAIAFEGAVAFVIRFILIIIAIPLLGVHFPATPISWVWLAVSVLVLHLSALSIGLLLAPWATLYGDVRKALRSLNLPLVLVSPIFYGAVERTDSLLYWVNVFNPLAPPLAVLGGVLQGDKLPYYALPLLMWGMLTLAALIWSLSKLHRQIPILLERLGS